LYLYCGDLAAVYVLLIPDIGVCLKAATREKVNYAVVRGLLSLLINSYHFTGLDAI
jgi:hypothetical protein